MQMLLSALERVRARDECRRTLRFAESPYGPDTVGSSALFAELYESVRELGASATSVSKLSDEEPERLRVDDDRAGARVLSGLARERDQLFLAA